MRKAIFIGIGVYGVFLGFCGGMVFSLNKNLPSIEGLSEYGREKVSKIYDRMGKVVYEFYEKKKYPVKLEKIPTPLVQTTLLMEDKNFYYHQGIDIFGILRATIYNILNLKVTQGGSTITQQLARNLFLSQAKHIIRKIKEIILAIKIEHMYSKEEILEFYFNNIYYGNGAYGIGAGAREYFGKEVEDLTVVECALLAGLPKCPRKYDPYRYPERSLKRRNFILKKMEEWGIISKKESKELRRKELGVRGRERSRRGSNYFVEEIRKWVIAKYGPDLLYRGGLSIYTSMDWEIQKIAEKVLQKGIEKIEEKYKIPKNDTLQGALVVLDPTTGEILAMVGGRDWTGSMFNRAIQAKRQPGSAFKPFIWMSALMDTFTPSTIVEDEPITIEIPNQPPYSPNNYDHKYLGKITLRDAIIHSRNLVSVRLIQSVSSKRVISLAKRMGITTPLEEVFSLALGSCEVTLLDLVSSYGILANQGVKVKSWMIDKISDKDGSVLYVRNDLVEEIISPQLAYMMTSLLESVVNEGTGLGVRMRGIYYSVAGKTGTTNECADAWFIGYTPEIVCGVWVGFDEVKRIGRNATGGKVAVPIWVEMMKEMERIGKIKYQRFREPEGIVKYWVCKICGKIRTTEDENTREEIFMKGKEPKDYCRGFHIIEEEL